ncbi:hypothetical protein [Salinisphaera sp. LB1]|nr:hypothetical protein [Salinisphaera sp. LB1]
MSTDLSLEEHRCYIDLDYTAWVDFVCGARPPFRYAVVRHGRAA